MTDAQTPSSSHDAARQASTGGGSASGASRRRIISFNCKGCRRRYHVPAELGGRTVRCKRCDTYRVIPMVSDPPLEEDADDLAEV